MKRQTTLKVEVDAANDLLQKELKQRLQTEADKGMVDLKAMCSTDRDSTTNAKLWTLNNVLRLADKGVGKRRVIPTL